MACITCGKGLKKNELDFLRRYKSQFNELGVERYVYRMSKNESWKVIKKNGFLIIFDEVKANFEQGAEYYHIKEFTG